MTARLPGVGGSLFPGQYLAERLMTDAAAAGARERTAILERKRREIDAWWARLSQACGPASGLRALFDVAALPLFSALGFRAHGATFERGRARVHLSSSAGTPVALVVKPWAARPPEAWREVVSAAAEIGADWGFVLAPPYLSLVDARGHAARRAIDFAWPEVIGPESFAVLWTVSNARALETGARPASPLRALLASADRFEAAVRADLQEGVVDAMTALVAELGRWDTRQDASGRFQEALTIVYRVLFLLFAESRDLVPHRHPLYRQAYAVSEMCREAARPEAARGLWEGLAAITRLSRAGCRADDLIVRPFNGRLFARSAAPSLEARPVARRSTSAPSRDRALQRTLTGLATRPGVAGRESINYADLGVEQLGAVYERVLDLDPATLSRPAAANPPAATPRPGRHSRRRKESGTFYTPQALCDFVVRRTLAPLVSGATSDAILSLRVVDPAMGSGAFLVAACRYLAAAYEHALIEEGRAAASDLDDRMRSDIRRLIAERCLAGVDINPVAVQLARLSLWLATLADGKPLGFLDHRLRTGNSLLGASPDDLHRVADRRPSPAREFVLPLFDDARFEDSVRRITRPLVELATRRDDTVKDVHAKEAAWAAVAGERSPLRPWRLASSLWCARWFWRGRPPAPPEMRAAIHALLKGDATLRASHLDAMLAASAAIDAAHGFFHWPLEFPDVFYDETGQPRTRPGFDAVLGNPPWEMLRRDAAGEPAGAEAAEPGYRGLVNFIRESGLYPACQRGHMNLYQPFVERAVALTRPGGRVGLVVPWGLAVDEGAAALRALLLDRTAIDVIVGLDNADAIFPIHRGLRFMALVASPGGSTNEVNARFGVRSAPELASLPAGDDDPAAAAAAWPVRLTAHGIRATGGPARRIADVRRAGDLDLLERVARAHPPLGGARGWGARFGRELNATEDRRHFGERGLPVIEGKHVRPFSVDARSTRRRIERGRLARLLPDGRHDRPRLAYRDVSGVANRLSLIAAIVPGNVVTTHTLFCLRTPATIEQQCFLCAVFNSYVLNAIVRMLMGGHLTTGLIEGLPVPPWTGSAAQRRIARLARRLGHGSRDPRVAARLQAAVAREYRIDDATFRHILDGFPLVAREDRHRALAALRAVERRRTRNSLEAHGRC